MKITRSNDLPFSPGLTKGKFANNRKQLSPPDAKIACGLWELPAGKRSFPMHKHSVTEEAMYVLSGRAKVRTPSGETPIGPGDWVTFPVGAGAEAHQLVNDGKEPLVYLAMSTNAVGVDVVEYPESKKIASSIQRGAERKRYIFKEANQADYFDGEDV